MYNSDVIISSKLGNGLKKDPTGALYARSGLGFLNGSRANNETKDFKLQGDLAYAGEVLHISFSERDYDSGLVATLDIEPVITALKKSSTDNLDYEVILRASTIFGKEGFATPYMRLKFVHNAPISPAFNLTLPSGVVARIEGPRISDDLSFCLPVMQEATYRLVFTKIKRGENNEFYGRLETLSQSPIPECTLNSSEFTAYISHPAVMNMPITFRLRNDASLNIQPRAFIFTFERIPCGYSFYIQVDLAAGKSRQLDLKFNQYSTAGGGAESLYYLCDPTGKKISVKDKTSLPVLFKNNSSENVFGIYKFTWVNFDRMWAIKKEDDSNIELAFLTQ